MAPVGLGHGWASYRLVAPLAEFAARHGLGVVLFEVGFVLQRGPDTVRAPDVFFLRHRDLPPDQDLRRFVEGPPTLAIEVVSPSERERELHTKIGEYLDAGSARVWVVRPEQQTVTVYRAGGDVAVKAVGHVLDSNDAAFEVPGFSLAVAEVFKTR